MLSRGDTLVVWKLDRLGRLRHLVVPVEELRDRGINSGVSLTPSTPVHQWGAFLLRNGGAARWNVSLSLNVHALDLMQLAQKVV